MHLAWRRLRLLAWAAALVACSGGEAASKPTVDGATAAHAIDTAFVNAWLRDDTTAVLDLFAPDAVLIPPGGKPVAGRQAIQDYWWPNDGSHTTIKGFERQVIEVVATDSLAFMRANATLQWVYTKGSTRQAQTSRSTDLVLLAPDARGQWHIIRQMWTQVQ